LDVIRKPSERAGQPKPPTEMFHVHVGCVSRFLAATPFVLVVALTRS
jgi:hypothetical protein